MVSGCRNSTVSRYNTCSRCYPVAFIGFRGNSDEHCIGDERCKNRSKYDDAMGYSCEFKPRCECNISC